jgi:hypothetical protein
MTTITKSIVTTSGKKVDLSIEINDSKVSGLAVCNGQQWAITGYANVQNRKCLSVKGGPAPYLPIDNNLYDQIHNTAKTQYQANMSAEAKSWETVCALEAAYKKLIDRSDSNAEIIQAQAAYEKSLSNFSDQYPNSDYAKSNRVHYNDKPASIWTN